MGLSSNILWHQTTSPSLRKILKSRSFRCSYSLEEVDSIIGKKLAFPMISMCDLPISEFSEFQGKYGDYSIGLSHEWGVKKKFSPIWYYEPKSRVPQLILKIFEKALNNHNESILSLMGILSYMKKIEGPLQKHNYSLYRFYDEREVRYVPSFKYLASGGDRPILTAEEYDEYKTAHKGNASINVFIRFEWSDIRYIIVKEDKQIGPMIEYLEKLGCNNKTISVFSSKQIFQDFIGYKHNVKIKPTTSKSINENTAKQILKQTLDMLKTLGKV